MLLPGPPAIKRQPGRHCWEQLKFATELVDGIYHSPNGLTLNQLSLVVMHGVQYYHHCLRVGKLKQNLRCPSVRSAL
ncbi:uncharacterized protein CIMG_12898 [Coccidioides immitis RS]|uniref:Uncharacterized protein n=1 Tax=Coccidioides immitis (strain RS) TaxID=246410 RepID=A0A0D8JSU3_COCIM|nr:uncharacterized protein CIMG_12898 [Coccidioides immitis RS]KJF60357.1 hypothetical protein CIMG_12898 [Coccidioides immitis RS]